ncbi:MAG: hypothetical protein N4A59_02950 [Marinifilum sp.]|jgi:hypothetical protein|nr:hypothetical protein [Marinifilum sp.]
MKIIKTLLQVLMLLLIALTAHSCWLDDLFKEKKELPSITQSGKDTFGCLVDGELWLPKGRLLYNSEYSIKHEPYMDTIYIDIYASNEGNSGFRFSIPREFIKIGENKIKKEIGRGSGIRYHIKGKPHYFTEESVGKLVITSLDTITNNVNVTPYRITSGTFWFDLFNEDGEKVEVREGRFDLRDYENIYR